MVNCLNLIEAQKFFEIRREGIDKCLCLSHSGTYKKCSSVDEAKRFFIDNGDEPVDYNGNLYVELNAETKEPLTPEQQSGVVWRSTNRLATQEEIKEAREYFRKHHKCKFHLFHDTPSFLYDIRKCGICGESLGLI